MFVETGNALRAKIAGLAYTSLGMTPSIVFDADPRVVGEEQRDPDGCSIGIALLDFTDDPKRTRNDAYLQFGTDDDDLAIVVDYPLPHRLVYQFDLRVPDFRPDLMAKFNELWWRQFSRDGTLAAAWTIGAYTVAANLVYHRTEPPQIMNGVEGEGSYRTTYRYEVLTWLFEETTPQTISTIGYRLFDIHVADEDIATDESNFYLIANPDDYSGPAL